MNRLHTKQDKGFTIIEVVLVLAIAGLIFLMVFIALPSLQKSQRDTQRKGDLARVSTQLNNYVGSTRGNIPTESSLGIFVSKYLGDGATNRVAGSEYSDPSTGPYAVRYNDETEIISPADGTIYYSNGQICSDTSPGDTESASPRNYALRLKLENQTALHCIDNR